MPVQVLRKGFLWTGISFCPLRPVQWIVQWRKRNSPRHSFVMVTVAYRFSLSLHIGSFFLFDFFAATYFQFRCAEMIAARYTQDSLSHTCIWKHIHTLIAMLPLCFLVLQYWPSVDIYIVRWVIKYQEHHFHRGWRDAAHISKSLLLSFLSFRVDIV